MRFGGDHLARSTETADLGLSLSREALNRSRTTSLVNSGEVENETYYHPLRIMFPTIDVGNEWCYRDCVSSLMTSLDRWPARCAVCYSLKEESLSQELVGQGDFGPTRIARRGRV
jgi:hypothetical protein